MIEATASDYARRFRFRAPREHVFDAIVTLEGVQSWWTPDASGSTELGGEFELEFEGVVEREVLRVERSARPLLVEWTCLAHSGHPEWEGTKMRFALTEAGRDECELAFRHVGLVPELRCYDVCERGWDFFLGSSLAGLVERGEGLPFRPARTPLEIVRTYHGSWTSGNFDAARRLLDPELETDVPLNDYAGREDFVADLAGFGALVSRADVLAEFENGSEALLLYDLEADGVGPLRVAEHFTIAQGRITRIRHVHDTAQLRKAGFAA
jgi:uncharacterized protein YndB with AHSA1/START domain